MGYQALLFCPDDKTARTVTQVLSELEFTVEACIEPFAAVKKLMGQHFDAVVVDCDNEQNATLLFKSARNSTSNQTSLAVAVVEGQAGVAKAFRIGANLVLTKPINIEQAKGTLRVARGLLRKSEPAKPGGPAATASMAVPSTPAAPTAAPAKPAPKPVAAKPPVPARPSTLPPRPVPPTAVSASRPPEVQAPKPASQAWPAAASASATPDDDLLGIEAEKLSSVEPPAPTRIVAASPKTPAPFVAPGTSGAASAPAPAREPQPPVVEKSATSAADNLFEKPVEPVSSEPSAYVGSAPSFTFGATAEAQSSGGNKKIFLGVAAALLLVAGGYFGFTHFKGSSNPSTPAQPAPVASTPAPKPSSVSPAPVTSAPTTTATVSQPEAATSAPVSNQDANDEDSSAKETSPRTATSSTKTSASPAPAKNAADKPESTALVVRGGKAPAVSSKPAAADAPPPSVIGLAATDTAALPNLGTSSDNGPKPVLQTLSISQGVSQGLLYKKVAPIYPPNAMRMRVEGAVELQATVSKDGAITHIKVLSGNPQLQKAATDAVKQWKYKPYLLNGEPVEIQTQITVNFKMPH